MINIKDNSQKDLIDSWSFLSPKHRKLLDETWAGLFQMEILCELPIYKLVSFFNDDLGRITKDEASEWGPFRPGVAWSSSEIPQRFGSCTATNCLSGY